MPLKLLTDTGAQRVRYHPSPPQAIFVPNRRATIGVLQSHNRPRPFDVGLPDSVASVEIYEKKNISEICGVVGRVNWLGLGLGGGGGGGHGTVA